ncbi:MAG: hypothetical protein OXM55_01525, partial [Bdellovibrionales bacterium]|nr:hypothetical protein [Bdellovibrionales bacterium]
MYEHYIALDWSKSNMAIARITKKGKKAYVEDIPSNISYLKDYLKNLKGKKILTFSDDFVLSRSEQLIAHQER